MNGKYDSWREGRTKAEQLKEEQKAGAIRVARAMAEGLMEQVAKDYMIPKPKVVVPDVMPETWEVQVTYYVDGVGDVTRSEPFNDFPSDELRTILMLLGKQR